MFNLKRKLCSVTYLSFSRKRNIFISIGLITVCAYVLFISHNVMHSKYNDTILHFIKKVHKGKLVKIREYPDFDYKYERNRRQHKESLNDFGSFNLIDANLRRLKRRKQLEDWRLIYLNRRQQKYVQVQRNMTNNAHIKFVVGEKPKNVGSYQDNIIYDEFDKEESKKIIGLGDFGVPIELNGSANVKALNLMKSEAFNIVASDLMSYHRIVPDTRDPLCYHVKYDVELPPASVVIVFIDEAWSTLIRTIWSVLDKSPLRYLLEIILIDDFSSKEHLKDKLERYIQSKFSSKVKLFRLPHRHGLIKARLEGAKLASGDVIVFLDSHCECGKEWLSPLLQRIKNNPKSFVVPIIDVIDDKTLEYYDTKRYDFQIGGFTWSGHFNWVDVSQREKDYRRSDIGPTRSPTMAGGIFAVKRSYFWEIGSYDDKMEIWGGENLEMSFRIWQCGGLLEIIPCSRVGHIFRSFHPYSFPGKKDTHGLNTVRVAEVWMDDYKRLFYMYRPDLLHADIGSIVDRQKLRKKLHCRSFAWYLENIFPEKFILDDLKMVVGFGRIRNTASNLCLDVLQNNEDKPHNLGVYICNDPLTASQFYSYSKFKQLRREECCATVEPEFIDNFVTMVKCRPKDEHQMWSYNSDDGHFIHLATGMCLNIAGDISKPFNNLEIGPCKIIPSQIWEIETMAEHNT